MAIQNKKQQHKLQQPKRIIMPFIYNSEQLLKKLETNNLLKNVETNHASLKLQSLHKCISYLYTIINPEKLYNFFLSNFNIAKLHNENIKAEDICHLPMPYKNLKEHLWIPLQKGYNSLTIGFSNPGLEYIAHDLAIKINMRIKYCLIPYKLCLKLHRELQSILIYQQYQTKLTLKKPLAIKPHPDMKLLLTQILDDAILHLASDIHIELNKNKIDIRIRKQGVLSNLTTIDASHYSQIINFIKIQANLDISQQQLPQDGQIQFNMPNNDKIDCRISMCPLQKPGVQYEKCVIRILSKHRKILSYKELHMPNNMQKTFLHSINLPQGLILVTGPTGSGKTNTIYSALQELNSNTKNIATIEDPIEIPIPGINQASVQNKIGRDFSCVLRSFLRQDPDVLMIGEIRDTETATIAIHAAQTGHLVLATLHTNSACETVTRLLHLGIPAYQVADSLRLIIAQRLIRTLCIRCRKPYIKKNSEQITSYHPADGCSQCDLGLTERCAVFEMLVCSPTIREHIYKYETASILESIAKKQGFTTLRQSAEDLIKNGVISEAEANRSIPNSNNN